MADLPVFLLANLVIDDPARYRLYEKGFFPLLKRHGGALLTYDDAPRTLEGAAPPAGRLIILTFPSEAAVDAWYADPDYQAICEDRRAGSRLAFLTLVRGLPPRPAPTEARP